MVKGDGFVWPVQAFVFLETFPEMFLWCHIPLSTLYKVAGANLPHELWI